eukprot:360951-Chlamydomonas_euryale.AAC.5
MTNVGMVFTSGHMGGQGGGWGEGMHCEACMCCLPSPGTAARAGAQLSCRRLNVGWSVMGSRMSLLGWLARLVVCAGDGGLFMGLVHL